MADTMLDIINENDEIIGQAMRSEIHGKGLLHREIHVWFITPDKQVIFQKRSMKKETSPGLLTTAVGGHVELGQDYLETAVIEALEETGVVIRPEDIVYLNHYKTDRFYPESNVHNRSIRYIYGTIFKGNIDELRVEEGDGDGFVVISFDALTNPSPEVQKQMPEGLLEIEFAMIKDALEKLVI